MTTNKPSVVAWVSSLDLAKLRTFRNSVGCILTDGPTKAGNDTALVSLSEFNALQAELNAVQAECRQLLSEAAHSMVHNPVCQREVHGPCMCRDCVLARIGPFVASIQEGPPCEQS